MAFRVSQKTMPNVKEWNISVPILQVLLELHPQLVKLLIFYQLIQLYGSTTNHCAATLAPALAVSRVLKQRFRGGRDDFKSSGATIGPRRGTGVVAREGVR